MIEFKISIEQKPAPEGKVGCQMSMKIESIKPQPEEIKTASILLEKIRELAEQICQEGENVRMNIVETRTPRKD